MANGESQAGFTFLELLVALAIVALLAALAMPELAATRDAWQRQAARQQQRVEDQAAARLARDRDAQDLSPPVLARAGYLQLGWDAAVTPTRDHAAEK
jgi:prepilin-type N-terminal cleavage/methylation domain-containing protein